MLKPSKTPVGYMFDCELEDIIKDEKQTRIVLKTTATVNDDIYGLFEEPLECAIKKIRAKKSNNANSYCWELCAAIGAAVKLSSIDVYKEAVRSRGMYKDYVVPIDRFDEVSECWSELGIGWFAEKVDFASEDEIIVRCYYGTSTYNSLQMSNVIDYLVLEAENLDITTLSKGARSKLTDSWHPIDVNIDIEVN